MMKIRHLPAFIFTLLILGSATIGLHAQDRPDDTEIGLIIGEPTGLSMKFWTGGNRAFDLGLAWSLGRGGAVHIHGDYLFHGLVDTEAEGLIYYYGLGARALLIDNSRSDDVRFGARIPVGLQYIIPDSRLSVFFELAPLLDIVPSTTLDVNGGVGVRIFI